MIIGEDRSRTRLRGRQGLGALAVGVLAIPLLVMCGGDEDASPSPDGSGEPSQASDATTVTTDGAPVGSDAGAPVDGSVPDADAPSDAGPVDAAVEASLDAADSGPVFRSFLAFCGNSPFGGVVAVYRVDDRNGALERVDQNGTEAGVQDFPAGMNTLYTAVRPDGRSLYCSRGLAAGLSPTIGAFAIDDAGVVGNLGAASIPEQPKSVAVHPSGAVLYAIGTTVTSNGIYSYPLGAGGGISAGTYAGWANDANELAVDRLGRFVFVGGGNELWVHRVSAADAGALSLAPFHLPDSGGYAGYYVGDIGDPHFVAVHPSLDVLYVSFSSKELGAYAYDSASGALTPLGTLPTDVDPRGVAVHPDGKHLFVAHATTGAIGVYTLGVNGSLSGRTSASAAPATAIAVEPSGKYVFTTGGAEVRGYAILTDGGLGFTGSATGPGSSSGNPNDIVVKAP